MHYDSMIEMDNITLQDCVDLCEKRSFVIEINDGHIINFIKDGD